MMPNWDDLEDFFSTKEASFAGGIETGSSAAAAAFLTNTLLTKAPGAISKGVELAKNRWNRICQGPNCAVMAPKDKRWRKDPETGQRLCPKCRNTKTAVVHKPEYPYVSEDLENALANHDPNSHESHRNLANHYANKARASNSAYEKAELWDKVRHHNTQAKLLKENLKNRSDDTTSPLRELFKKMPANEMQACSQCGRIDSRQNLVEGVCSNGIGCDD